MNLNLETGQVMDFEIQAEIPWGALGAVVFVTEGKTEVRGYWPPDRDALPDVPLSWFTGQGATA